MKTKFASLLRAALAAQRRRFLPAFVLSLVATVFPCASAHAQTITSAVPGLVSYQGKVTNASGTAVGTGTPVNRTVIFRIWSHSSNSTFADLVYSEQQTVTISEGEFSVLIGQGTAVSGTPLGYSESSKGPPTITFNNSFAIFGGAARYLGVTVDDGTAAADPEVSPRQQLVTSAYAFRARYAEGLGSNGNFSVAVTDQGNFGVGIANPIFPITTTATLGDKIGLFGNFNYGIGLQLSTVQIHGAAAVDDIAFGYGPSAAMTETVRFKGNGNVGIGTANPTAKLDVNGAINVFDGGIKSLAGGLVSEAGAGMVNFGMNDTRFGTPQANTSQGGFLRVNTQGVSNLFQFYARPANATTLSEVMSITSAGNVGIGTSPATKLDVSGGIRASGASGYTFSGVGDTDGGLFSPADGIVTLWTNNSERLRVDSNGNLGVGTASPGRRLHIVGAGDVEIGVQSSDASGRLWTLQSSAGASSGTFQIIDRTATASRLAIDSAGNVGVGTTAPSAKLHVSGGIKVDSTNFIELGAGVTKEGSAGRIGYNTFTADALDIVGAGTTGSNRKIKFWNEGGATFTGLVYVAGSSAQTFVAEAWGNTQGFGDLAAPTRTENIGLQVDQSIRAGLFFVNSDSRLKSVVGRSAGSSDLALLQQIKITDYTLKDTITNGRRTQKKIIAQELEQIFPQAVSQSTGVVPDIYQKAIFVDGWIALATDLSVGERVRLVGDGADGVHEVLEVQPGRFRTAFTPKSEKIFVYGREVKDFRTVDYDAISMLNVSATQEIKREKDAEVAALRTANAELTQRVAELEAKDRARDAKLAAIEKLLSASSTVMALPAKSATANGQD